MRPRFITLAQPELTDFGLTKLVEDTGGFTTPGAVLGAVDYMALELLAAQPQVEGFR